jgi:hypothetical protein
LCNIRDNCDIFGNDNRIVSDFWHRVYRNIVTIGMIVAHIHLYLPNVSVIIIMLGNPDFQGFAFTHMLWDSSAVRLIVIIVNFVGQWSWLIKTLSPIPRPQWNQTPFDSPNYVHNTVILL